MATRLETHFLSVKHARRLVSVAGNVHRLRGQRRASSRGSMGKTLEDRAFFLWNHEINLLAQASELFLLLQESNLIYTRQI
jgi:hypothetical protein